MAYNYLPPTYEINSLMWLYNLETERNTHVFCAFQIIEFLVQVQRLEEMNYSADLAEKALIANDHKQTETVQYLNILSQLMDLGFAKEKVSVLCSVVNHTTV